MKQLIEIRSYNLKAGQRAAFHRLVLEESLPLLKKWQVDVVAFGPSAHDSTSYYLMRAYASLAARQASQEAFYSSADWRLGPRAAIVALIESDTSIVLELDAAMVAALRQNLNHPPATQP